MLLRKFAIVAALSIVPLAAHAEEASAAQEAIKPAKPKKICRVDEEVVGTRLGSGKVCKTAEDWAKYDENHKNAPKSNRATRSFGGD